MNRFFSDHKEGEYLLLDMNVLKHLKVIRANNKNFVVVFNEEFYECCLENDKAKIISKINEYHEIGYEVILAASIIKIDRYEWLLQKAIELGATRIVPIISEHTDGSLYKNNKFINKYERFNSIIKSASEQSFRNKLIKLDNPMSFNEAIIKYRYINNKIIAHEKIDLENNDYRNINSDVIIFVGPEGGYSKKEIDLSVKNDYKVVSLGRRILRAESASIYLLSQLIEK
ncbi:16S rRNA (uracil(1498)-N(3))-methyltransferase [Mycoplasma crocodyli]|uniref:Ribosomal RNA small subunit methyltransferase E n=1 Tax=Mycoplasma crocodyli (strain ATCC 51981 / MP145) TaxID=512564 RepID=D5E5L5_MYCCM|nr:16S rRNA (uracil(1498)-N(3))-methyltransferase [Mycoplasma crocodyli]ADE19396.1 RNA methyltransferase, RsmE family [Mycoplasma crocodyli MP145]